MPADGTIHTLTAATVAPFQRTLVEEDGLTIRQHVAKAFCTQGFDQSVTITTFDGAEIELVGSDIRAAFEALRRVVEGH